MNGHSDLRRGKLFASCAAFRAIHALGGGLRQSVLLALLVLGAALRAGAVPANDNFDSATVITGVSGATFGNSVGATKEPGEPNHAGNAGGASVWFRWVAPANGTVTFNTEGSSFDTLLGVYIGTSVSALSPVASNDDVQYPADLTSAVTFDAVSGTEYRIAVDGYGGLSGNYALTWLYPVVNETVLSTAVTNLSNFIYDSDALIGGVYNRDKLLISSTVLSANTSSALHYTTYVLSYRLLDTNSLPQPIYDSSGLTNADYTCNVTNTLLIGAFSSVSSTTPAAVKPAAKLDPYNQYSIELKIFRLGVFTGATGSYGPAIYLEFTNLVSGDVALNAIPYQFLDTWVQIYAIKTAPGKTTFQASTGYGLYR